MWFIHEAPLSRNEIFTNEEALIAWMIAMETKGVNIVNAWITEYLPPDAYRLNVDEDTKFRFEQYPQQYCTPALLVAGHINPAGTVRVNFSQRDAQLPLWRNYVPDAPKLNMNLRDGLAQIIFEHAAAFVPTLQKLPEVQIDPMPNGFWGDAQPNPNYRE